MFGQAGTNHRAIFRYFQPGKALGQNLPSTACCGRMGSADVDQARLLLAAAVPVRLGGFQEKGICGLCISAAAGEQGIHTGA